MATLDLSLPTSWYPSVFFVTKENYGGIVYQELLVGLGEAHSCLKRPVFLVTNP